MGGVSLWAWYGQSGDVGRQLTCCGSCAARSVALASRHSAWHFPPWQTPAGQSQMHAPQTRQGARGAYWGELMSTAAV